MVKQLQRFFFLFSLCLFFLAGCGSAPEQPQQQPVSELLPGAGPVLQSLNDTLGLINNGELTLARAQLQKYTPDTLDTEEYGFYQLAQAQLLASTEPMAALQLLNETTLQDRLLEASPQLQVRIGLYKASLLEQLGFYFSAAKLRVFIAPMIDEQSDYLQNHQAIWHALNQLTQDDISRQINPDDHSVFQQWLPLSLMMQHTDLPLNQQIAQLQSWQEQHPTHPASLIPLPEMESIRTAAEQRPQKIAIILPFDGRYRLIGEAVRDGLMFAYYQTSYQPQLVFYATEEEQSFTDIYQEAVADGAEMVIGPLFKSQLEELYQLPQLPVPTIALNKLEQENKPANLYEFSMAPEDEIHSLVRLALQENHQNAVVIAQQANWAGKAAETFTDVWLAEGKQVLASGSFSTTKEQSDVIQKLLNIDKSKQRIRELGWLAGENFESEPRRRQDIDMIVILAKPQLAASLRPLLAFHFASDLPVYATSSVYRGYADTKADNDLNGIHLTDIPLVISPEGKLSDKYAKSTLVRMYAFGMDVFRLSERIRLMTALPATKLYGSTGELTLAGQDINRETAFAQFRHGRIRPIAKLTQAGLDNSTTTDAADSGAH